MHIDIHMASKNVALHMSLVRRLDQLKRPGESYTNVIERHLPQQMTVGELADYLRENPERLSDELTALTQEARRLANEPRRRGR